MTAGTGVSAHVSPRRAKPVILAHIPECLAGLGLVLSLLYLFWTLGNAGPAVVDSLWITSDTLYPVNVTTDILHDGYPLSGWRFSIAPCWFPDLFTTGLFWVFTHNAITATLLAGFIQLALIVGAFHLMRRAIGLGSASLQTVLLLGVSVWITLYVGARPAQVYPDLYRFFIPQSHVGGLIMTLYALVLAFLLVDQAHKKSRISRATATAYAVVCLAAGMSNLMFFPQILAPFTAAIALAIFFNILPASKCWAPVAIAWPAAIAGAIINRVLLHATSVAAQSQISREAALTALDVFMRGAVEHLFDPLHILALLWFAVCIAIVAMTLRKLARQQAQQVQLPDRLLWVFCSCWIFADLLSAGAVIFGGSNYLTLLKSYTWTTHYLQAIFFIPLFGLPLIAVWLIPQRIAATITRGAVWSWSLLVIAVPAVRLGASPVPKSGITSYRPALVEFLDNMASKRGLKYGFGGYWQSRITTLLSKVGLRVYAVEPSLQPFLWVTNINWYTASLDDRHQQPPFRFVVLDDPAFTISRESAVEMFGQPSEEVRFHNTRVLIYSSQMAWDPILAGVDAPLAEFSEQITSPIANLRANPGETIMVPVRIRNPTGEQWTSAGKYPINLSYKWFVSGRMLSIEGRRTPLRGKVKPGGEVSLTAQVEVPKEGTNLILKLSLVQEGVAWFFIRGATALDIPVKLKGNAKESQTRG
jgi:hypothetical protein